MNNCNMFICVIDDIVMSNLGSCNSCFILYVGDDIFMVFVIVFFIFEEFINMGILDLMIGGEIYSVNVGYIYGSFYIFYVIFVVIG